MRALSLKGKNRIREHGEKWTISTISSNVPCLKGETGWLLRAVQTGYNCWMKAQGDEDFEEIVEEKKGKKHEHSEPVHEA